MFSDGQIFPAGQAQMGGMDDNGDQDRDRNGRRRWRPVPIRVVFPTPFIQPFIPIRRPDPLFVFIVDLFEGSTPYPVVQHRFTGRTPDEALSYYYAHLRTDEFLRRCVETGVWQTASCRAAFRWDRTEVSIPYGTYPYTAPYAAPYGAPYSAGY